jgi:two-component system, sensor histidine kinase and response regulator
MVDLEESSKIDATARSSLSRLRWVTVTIALVVGLLLPSFRYYFGVGTLERQLETLASELAAEISVAASTQPDMWMFERNALEVKLARAILRERLDGIVLVDMKGKELAAWGDITKPFRLTVTAEVLDSGLPVGQLQLTSNKRDILVSVAWLALLGALIGATLYYLITRITYRSLRQSMVDLREARLSAEAASRARSAFLATMSHEIRTPMNGVIGMASLLESTALNGEQRSYLETIRSSGQALVTVIDDILEYSRIESGKIDLEAIEFDPVEIIEDVTSLLATQATAKGLELVCQVNGKLPDRVLADGQRVRQALTNLVGNAIKFTERGQIVVTAMPRGDSAIAYQVADTGIGISPEQQLRIFNPFVQADSSTTRRYGGTGLGLAITRSIIEQMGGSVSLQSELGQGATFTVEMPVKPAISPPAEQSADRAELLSALRGKRVLLADTTPANLRTLTTVCEQYGLQVHKVKSVDEVQLRMQVPEPFDFAIVDYEIHANLPGKSLSLQLRETTTTLRAALMLPLGSAISDSQRSYDVRLHKPLRRKEIVRCLAQLAQQGAMSERLSKHAKQKPNRVLRVLIAEDNIVNSMVLKAMVASCGHTPTVVVNGALAVEAISRAEYDIVLMDMLMPVMDGLEATRQIRQLYLSYRPNIIAVTANVLAEDRDACQAAGMDGFLPKPVTVEKLSECLNQRVEQIMSSETDSKSIRQWKTSQ